MVVRGSNNLSYFLANSHVTLRIQEDLCRFVHFSDSELSVEHDHSFVYDIELSAEQIVISQDAL